jgi:hypothetical protein
MTGQAIAKISCGTTLKTGFPAIRHLVKSTYYDFNNYHIIEPTLNGVTSLISSKLEGRTTWKTVKVVDGEMEEVEEYFKLK